VFYDMLIYLDECFYLKLVYLYYDVLFNEN